MSCCCVVCRSGCSANRTSSLCRPAHLSCLLLWYRRTDSERAHECVRFFKSYHLVVETRVLFASPGGWCQLERPSYQRIKLTVDFRNYQHTSGHRFAPLRVKMRRARIEHMSAGLPLKADIARRGWHGRKVPIPAVSRCSTECYSITSSARASSSGGTSSPSVLAVLRLTASSNLTGCSTGRSAGLAPFKI